MASFADSTVDVDLNMEVKEYLNIFHKNFQDQMLSLSEGYAEGVSRFFQYCENNSSRNNETVKGATDEIEAALQRLLVVALKLSQALIEKQIQKKR